MMKPTSPIAKLSVRSPQRGFTLIELLLAITIGSVVMAAVYATFNTAIGSQQRIQRAAEASQASRFFMELVRRDLKQLAARAESLTGRPEQLELVLAQPDGTQHKVTYSHRSASGSNDIVRSVQSADGSTQTIVYQGVESLGFRYVMDGSWHTETSRSVLPQAIECALQIGEWVQRFSVTLEVENVPVES